MPSKDQPYVRGNPKENQQDHDRNRGHGRAQRSSHSWRQRFEVRFCVVQFAILRYVVISNNKLAGNVRCSLQSGKLAACPVPARVVNWNGKDVTAAPVTLTQLMAFAASRGLWIKERQAPTRKSRQLLRRPKASRHTLTLSGRLEHDKLLIPLKERCPSG